MADSDAVKRAKTYLRGSSQQQGDLDKLYKDLKKELEFGYAWRVLERYERDERVRDISPNKRQRLCQQHALCLSKDPDTSAAVRHDKALDILRRCFTLEAGTGIEVTTDQETLGIAGGIWKRKWRAFGQIEDLQRSLACYERGYEQGVDKDFGYTGVNAAFVHDLLAHIGDRPEYNRERAAEIRSKIVAVLQAPGDLAKDSHLNLGWWYRATLAEAHFGLGNFAMAKALLQEAVVLPNTDYWEYEVTASQLVDLAWLQNEVAGALRPEIAEVIGVLTDSPLGVDSMLVGKVGLALSGGGFRASFFHLGVLARLAEVDVLRHVDVLSCVSGGSIIGAAYYLKVRQLFSNTSRSGRPLAAADYVQLVGELMTHFQDWVSEDVRARIQGGWLNVLQNLWTRQGGLDSNRLAAKMDELLYASLVNDPAKLRMHDLNVRPADHDPAWRNQGEFNPKRHNWRRAHKVPQLILNATTMNTGHAWQFTTTWMGESPFAIHEEVDSVRRLRRAWYKPSPPLQGAREVTLGEAVAASAAVPGVSSPLRLRQLYELERAGKPFDVFLVDGGVYDNEGTVSLLAMDCNVLLVSDAAGQLLANHDAPSGIAGRLGFAGRSVSVLMERIRQANYADLKARVRTGQLRGLMFLHMKDDLNADPIEWVGSQEVYPPTPWEALTRCGVRRDIQVLLSDLRTDLNEFTHEESRLLMACGYQMACKLVDETLGSIAGLAGPPVPGKWPFAAELQELCSTDEEDRAQLLDRLAEGSKSRFNPSVD